MKQIMNSCFNITTTAAYRVETVWKLCLNLCLRRWFKPNCNLIINFTCLGLGQWKKEFALGRINFKMFLKTQDFQSSSIRIKNIPFFYSYIKECFIVVLFLKHSLSALYWEISFEFLIAYLVQVWKGNLGIVP